jgi:hypothetical protein
MHAKGYLSDIIPVSTAERDPTFPFSLSLRWIPLHLYGLRLGRVLGVFPLETATDEHFHAPRERP